MLTVVSGQSRHYAPVRDVILYNCAQTIAGPNEDSFLASPSIATIKQLFALSQNGCAFPTCSQPLIHEGKVTGRICHIKAASPGGPRYDPSQTPTDRHGFDNLVLMCPIHHDVIDADESSYTVDRLKTIKSEQESAGTPLPPISDEEASQLIINVGSLKIDGGSVIVTHNQSGGQVAHTITNLGPPKREISKATREKMLSFLAAHPRARIGFASTQGDAEAHEFKQKLISVFREASWDVQDLSTFMFFGSKSGLVITIPFNASEIGDTQTVAGALQITGSPVTGNKGDMANGCDHYVQVWHAP